MAGDDIKPVVDAPRDAKAAAAAAAAAADVQTRHILGGFISAGGVCVLVMVLSSIQRTWFADVDPPVPVFSIVWPLSIAVAALFWLVNPVGWPKSWPEKWIEAPRLQWLHFASPRLVAQIVLGAIALIAVHACFGGASDLLHGKKDAGKKPLFDQYVLSLPMVDASAAAQNEQGSATPNDHKAPPPKAAARSAATPQATLIWAAQRNYPALPSGILPTFLGGMLVAIFGIVFPRVVVSTATGVMTNGAKLVAPIASLALVGLGATQQATAAKADADTHQYMQGKGPILLSPHEQALRNFYQLNSSVSNSYLLDPGAISGEAAADLKQRIQQLRDDLNGDTATLASLGEASTTLDTDITKLQVIVGHLPQPGLAPDLAPVNHAIADLGAQLKGLGNVTGQGFEQIAAGKAARCAVLSHEAADLAPKAATLLKSATDKDAETDKFDKQWFGYKWFNRRPPSGVPDRVRGEALAVASLQADQQLAVYCTGAAKPPGSS